MHNVHTLAKIYIREYRINKIWITSFYAEFKENAFIEDAGFVFNGPEVGENK